MDVRELMKLEVDPAEVDAVYQLWKQHSIAEDNRDIAGLLATLTDDCVYQIVGTPERWEGHDGATRFYTGLLTAFPDIHFDLTDIVVGPQGVVEEAQVTATHEQSWLNWEPSGERVDFRVVIFFPWDRERHLFRGEKVYVHADGFARDAGAHERGGFMSEHEHTEPEADERAEDVEDVEAPEAQQDVGRDPMIETDPDAGAD
jgi:predicted ester cyclase